MSYKIIAEDNQSYEVEIIDEHSGKIDGAPFNLDVLQINNHTFHIIKDSRSYTIEILKANPQEKNYFVKINGQKFKFKVKDKFDSLLEQLGMSDLLSKKVSDLKAPMPGLVLSVDVNVGDEVQKGDPLLILEAMKMENVIKSPTQGKIKSIDVEKGIAVEKNQVLITFE